MLILGVDTSGKNGSIALVKFEQGSPRTLELVPLEGGTFSAQLIPQISELLGRHHLTKQDVDGFAIVSGPGSFTGLRVGLAAIKGLAEVLGKPIAAMSLLEAVARASKKTGEITAALDAGRDEVYIGRFDVKDGSVTNQEESVAKLGDLAGSSAREVVTPDARIADLARQHGLRAHCVPYPRADFIAILGFEKIKKGTTISPLDLDAHYIRRSDAEIKQTTPR